MREFTQRSMKKFTNP